MTHYPGHHINAAGKFDSDKYPELPEDLVAINVSKPRNWPGLLLIANAYQEKDPEFADDLRGRILALINESAPVDTCCREGCEEESVETFHHDDHTNTCAGHREELRASPWMGA